MAAEPSDESKWLKSHYEKAATGDVPTPVETGKVPDAEGRYRLRVVRRTHESDLEHRQSAVLTRSLIFAFLGAPGSLTEQRAWGRGYTMVHQLLNISRLRHNKTTTNSYQSSYASPYL